MHQKYKLCIRISYWLLVINYGYQQIVEESDIDTKRKKTSFATYKPLSFDRFNRAKKSQN